MYSHVIWDHIQNTRNRGVLAEANALGESRFSKCNDHLILQLRLEQGRIQDVRFLAKACGAVVATASLFTTQLVGLTPDQALRISTMQLDRDLGGLPGPKRHALWMCLEALQNAIEKFQSKSVRENQ
ncbi:MAG: iron-sulfur cluster assembly scaffold protein [Vulcanimicrobiota bacterium]